MATNLSFQSNMEFTEINNHISESGVRNTFPRVHEQTHFSHVSKLISESKQTHCQEWANTFPRVSKHTSESEVTHFQEWGNTFPTERQHISESKQTHFWEWANTFSRVRKHNFQSSEQTHFRELGNAFQRVSKYLQETNFCFFRVLRLETKHCPPCLGAIKSN